MPNSYLIISARTELAHLQHPANKYDGHLSRLKVYVSRPKNSQQYHLRNAFDEVQWEGRFDPKPTGLAEAETERVWIMLAKS